MPSSSKAVTDEYASCRVLDPRDLRHAHELAVAPRATTASCPPPRAERRRRDHPERELAVDFEREQRRPHRQAAGVPLGAVDRIDDPAARRADARLALLLTEHGVVGSGARELGPDHGLDRAVGFGDGREVGLGLDHEVLGAEPGQAQAVGRIGELERERKVLFEIGVGSDGAECSERGRDLGETGAVLDIPARKPVATSVDELIAGASARAPMESADSKSGARFERVVIDGERFVLKHVDTASDWIMRQTGDIGLCPVLTWERGIVDLAPSCIDHATVGAAREGRAGAVLMRDVSELMVPSGDAPISSQQHEQFLGAPRDLPRGVLGLGRHDRPHPARQPLLVLRP